MARPEWLQPGDRVALSARFLRAVGAHSGSMPARRGTFLAYDAAMSHGLREGYARVRWDDTNAAALGVLAKHWGDDYAADVEANGSPIFAGNVCKVGSARFACNDL